MKQPDVAWRASGPMLLSLDGTRAAPKETTGEPLLRGARETNPNASEGLERATPSGTRMAWATTATCAFMFSRSTGGVRAMRRQSGGERRGCARRAQVAEGPHVGLRAARTTLAMLRARPLLSGPCCRLAARNTWYANIARINRWKGGAGSMTSPEPPGPKTSETLVPGSTSSNQPTTIRNGTHRT